MSFFYPIRRIKKSKINSYGSALQFLKGTSDVKSQDLTTFGDPQ